METYGNLQMMSQRYRYDQAAAAEKRPVHLGVVVSFRMSALWNWSFYHLKTSGVSDVDLNIWVSSMRLFLESTCICFKRIIHSENTYIYVHMPSILTHVLACVLAYLLTCFVTYLLAILIKYLLKVKYSGKICWHQLWQKALKHALFRLTGKE